MQPRMILAAILIPALAFPENALAQSLDSGDTAWLATATVLVLFMTVPGLALFYGGMVRAGSVVSVMLQCFAITCLVTILWLIVGYSLAFGDSLTVVGTLNKLLYRGVGEDVLWGSVPEPVFATFQLTFTIITSALLVGTLVERLRFSAVLLFTAFWTLLVYAPVTHWVWGGGWLGTMGVLDFAGGIVVHVTAGATALVAILVLGPRPDFPARVPPPHNLTMMIAGAGMLWVGWMGFNGGSAMAADGNAGLAMVVTQIAAAAGAFTWMMVEWLRRGRPSALGTATGAIAGLATVTPGAGFVGPAGALLIGIAAGAVCFGAASLLRSVLKLDDSLDVVGVHLVGGALGTMLTGVFANGALGLFGGQETFSILRQIPVQAVGVAATIVYTGAMTWVILALVNAMVRRRVSGATVADGLDLAVHDEWGYAPALAAGAPEAQLALARQGPREFAADPPGSAAFVRPAADPAALVPEHPEPRELAADRAGSAAFVQPSPDPAAPAPEHPGPRELAADRADSAAFVQPSPDPAGLAPERPGPREPAGERPGVDPFIGSDDFRTLLSEDQPGRGEAGDDRPARDPFLSPEELRAALSAEQPVGRDPGGDRQNGRSFVDPSPGNGAFAGESHGRPPRSKAGDSEWDPTA